MRYSHPSFHLIGIRERRVNMVESEQPLKAGIGFSNSSWIILTTSVYRGGKLFSDAVMLKRRGFDERRLHEVILIDTFG